jgi:hypothetical protein
MWSLGAIMEISEVVKLSLPHRKLYMKESRKLRRTSEVMEAATADAGPVTTELLTSIGDKHSKHTPVLGAQLTTGAVVYQKF